MHGRFDGVIVLRATNEDSHYTVAVEASNSSSFSANYASGCVEIASDNLRDCELLIVLRQAGGVRHIGIQVRRLNLVCTVLQDNIGRLGHRPALGYIPLRC